MIHPKQLVTSLITNYRPTLQRLAGWSVRGMPCSSCQRGSSDGLTRTLKEQVVTVATREEFMLLFHVTNKRNGTRYLVMIVNGRVIRNRTNYFDCPSAVYCEFRCQIEVQRVALMINHEAHFCRLNLMCERVWVIIVKMFFCRVDVQGVVFKRLGYPIFVNIVVVHFVDAMVHTDFMVLVGSAGEDQTSYGSGVGRQPPSGILSRTYFGSSYRYRRSRGRRNRDRTRSLATKT
nr:hypothetical protein HmN_000988800 [Hymenolepis microstoma]